jgi:hypothetical protein
MRGSAGPSSTECWPGVLYAAYTVVPCGTHSVPGWQGSCRQPLLWHAYLMGPAKAAPARRSRGRGRRRAAAPEEQLPVAAAHAARWRGPGRCLACGTGDASDDMYHHMHERPSVGPSEAHVHCIGNRCRLPTTMHNETGSAFNGQRRVAHARGRHCVWLSVTQSSAGAVAAAEYRAVLGWCRGCGLARYIT